MKKLIPNISKMAMGGEPPRKTIYVSNKNNSKLKSYQDSLALYKAGEEKKLFWKNNPNASNIELNRKEYEINKKYPLSKNRNTFGTNMIEAIGMTKIGKGSDARSVPQYKKPVQPVVYIPKVTSTVSNKKIQMETTKLDTIPKTTNFEQRIQNPVLKINNKDGTTSTHKMMSFEADGKYYAAPTIVEQNGKLVELTTDEAFKYAMKNKEYKEFKTDKEAKDYANNGYKKGTPLSQTPPTPLTKKQYYEVPDANGKVTLLTPEQFSRMSSGNKNDLMSKSPIMNKPKYFYEINSSGKRQLVPESKIREYMQTKNK